MKFMVHLGIGHAFGWRRGRLADTILSQFRSNVPILLYGWSAVWNFPDKRRLSKYYFSDGRILTSDPNLKTFPSNGTLVINRVSRSRDAGVYSCRARNRQGQRAEGSTTLKVIGKWTIFQMLWFYAKCYKEYPFHQSIQSLDLKLFFTCKQTQHRGVNHIL